MNIAAPVPLPHVRINNATQPQLFIYFHIFSNLSRRVCTLYCDTVAPFFIKNEKEFVFLGCTIIFNLIATCYHLAVCTYASGTSSATVLSCNVTGFRNRCYSQHVKLQSKYRCCLWLGVENVVWWKRVTFRTGVYQGSRLIVGSFIRRTFGCSETIWTVKIFLANV